MKPLILLVAALALAGCKTTEPPEPVVQTKLVTIEPLPECLVTDPDWIEPTDDMRLKPAARRDQTNKENFNAMRSNRSVCREGLKANQNRG